jgi:hypothetical protein
MRDKAACVFLCTLALGTTVVCVRAEDQAVRKEIQGLFDHAAKLIEQKDVDSLVNLTAPGATFTMPGAKKLSAKEWAAETKKALATVENMKAKITLDQLTVKGKEAVAMATENDDYGLTQDKGHKYHETDKEKITLVKTAKGWSPSKLEFLSAKITRDGKPFTPPTPSNVPPKK